MVVGTICTVITFGDDAYAIDINSKRNFHNGTDLSTERSTEEFI